jgi:hypothetical protein
MNDEWVVTTNRFVAFIDIMGFKNMVSTLPHNEIYSMMKRIDARIKSAESMNWDKKDLQLIKTTTYSDSIMLYSKDDSLISIEHLVASVAALTHDLFIEGIPHKGGIAFGLMTLDTENSIFFGQPLIDAYLLQEELFFYGIILHGTCENQIKKVGDIKTISFVENHLCPLKNGNSNHFTVHPIFTSSKMYDEKRQKMFNSINDFRFTTSGGLRKYIDNTELYLRSIPVN